MARFLLLFQQVAMQKVIQNDMDIVRELGVTIPQEALALSQTLTMVMQPINAQNTPLIGLSPCILLGST